MTSTLYTNATVLTCDRSNSIAEAVAVADGRITAVGSEAFVRRTAGPDAAVVDLDGGAR